jgi:hypothetical protein
VCRLGSIPPPAADNSCPPDRPLSEPGVRNSPAHRHNRPSQNINKSIVISKLIGKLAENLFENIEMVFAFIFIYIRKIVEGEIIFP